MAEAWYDEDKATPAEFLLLREHGLRPGATVFNLGAFQAIVALMLAGDVGPGGRVVAVEGSPHNARVAQANQRLNHATQLTVIHGAVAASPGFVSFATELNGHIDLRSRLGNARVRAVTIDELAKEYGVPDVVYMDIEGHELEALRGASRVLAKGATTWSIEVHPETFVGGQPEELLALLEGQQIWLATDAATGPGLRYLPFDGTVLPRHRFFVVAAP
jgi:FkbM family methyltransferase